MSIILDGKKLANKLKLEYQEKVHYLQSVHGSVPGLAVILVGDNPASQVYVGHKEKMCKAIGIYSKVVRLSSDISESSLLQIIQELNDDNTIHGILVQLPLPKHIDERKVIEGISPKKDVDCFHPESTGRLFNFMDWMYPCTPSGIMELLHHYDIEISGKVAVVLGRSNIVGKPISMMLLKEDATVINCHSKTKDLNKYLQMADILVVAIGKKEYINSQDLKTGTVVIDVGIHRDELNKLTGDVNYEGGVEHLKAYTPVPGGVGPMTIMMLMKNTIQSFENSFKELK